MNTRIHQNGRTVSDLPVPSVMLSTRHCSDDVTAADTPLGLLRYVISYVRLRRDDTHATEYTL